MNHALKNVPRQSKTIIDKKSIKREFGSAVRRFGPRRGRELAGARQEPVSQPSICILSLAKHEATSAS